MSLLLQLKREMRALGNKQKAVILARFFKTGKGEYGEGDQFLGITVPVSRSIAKKYKELHFSDIKELLTSEVHEERLVALLILVHNFTFGDENRKREIYNYYLTHAKFINNWDLIDLTAEKIVGEFLLGKSIEVLEKLATSDNLWERRIAIISTYQFIKNNRFEETFKIAKILISDKHDLIHKAVGWMLREVGKRSLVVEKNFLKKYYRRMPRTMLRYAIERFPIDLRKAYLSGVM